MTEENMGDAWFHIKVNQMEEENSALREEVVKLDDKTLLLERINACLKRQLEDGRKKYDELQQEYDKLKIALEEAMDKEKMSKCAFKKSMTERQILTNKLEAAELEAQEIASLKEELKKVRSERSESTKKVVEMVKALEEEHTKCEFLQSVVKELEETNERLQKICESRENTIQILRETSRELADENAELKLLIGTNVRPSIDRDSITPNSDTESFYMHGTSSCESNGVVNQDSLYDELKASGFMNTYDRDDTINRQLEDQVRWYELEINKLLKQTERAFERLVSMYGEERFSLCVTKNLDNTECSEKSQNFETLKQRIQILLDMITTTPSKIVDIGSRLGADSEEIKNRHEVLNFHDHFEYALNTGNGSTSALTVKQNSHGETVQSDIVHQDGNFEVISERDLTRRDNIEFTNANVESHAAVILGCRRCKSESSLITEKKVTPLLHHSFNIFTMSLLPKKTCEAIERREKERENIEKTKEENGVQNLTSWHEYKFEGTYRSLNDSSDSSVCSTPSRHNSLLGSGDFSLNESCQQQQQHEFCPVYLAPTRFKRSLSRIPSFLEENGVNATDTSCQRINSNNGLIRSTTDRYDKRSMSPCRRLSNFYVYENFTANSTPILSIHTDSKDRNSCMYKKGTRQSSKIMRRSSCGSLVRRFVDLDISNDTNDSLNIHGECNLDSVNCNEHLQSVNCTNTPNVASVLNESSSYMCNTIERSSHAFTKHENSKERGIPDEMQFFITTTEETKDCIDDIQESIHETSLDYENNANGFEKSVHENLPDVEESQDILEKMKNSLEENNNVLQGNDFYTTSSVKSNDLLNGVCQNCEKKLTDLSKLQIVGSEKSLCTAVSSHAPTKSILAMPSWRMFVSCALVFILGYYLKDIISLRSTPSEAPCKWYSFEEILNRYFPIRSRKLRPL